MKGTLKGGRHRRKPFNDHSSLLVNGGDRLGDLRGGGEGLWRSSSELLEDELESA